MNTMFRTKLYENETIIATINMKKTRAVLITILNVLVISLFVIGFTETGFKNEDYQGYFLLFALIIVSLIGLFFIIKEWLRTSKTAYILTNQRIIIKDFVMFKFYGNSFKYGIVEDIEVKHNEIANTYNVEFFLDHHKLSVGIDSKRADFMPRFVSIDKRDLDILIATLNKYGKKKKK